MKPLPTIITRKGFTYRQIVREGDVAIYSQSHAGQNAPFAYEVIIIGSHGDIIMFDRPVAATETYPGDGEWGIRAWTVSRLPDNLGAAKELMAKLIAERAERAAKKAQSELDIAPQVDILGE